MLTLNRNISYFQTNNRQVVSGAANGGVRVWDVITGECLQHLRGHVKSVTAVTCTAEHLLSVSLESVLCIWDRSRGECLHRLKQVRFLSMYRVRMPEYDFFLFNKLYFALYKAHEKKKKQKKNAK